MTSPIREIVLPSGRFAAISRIRAVDLLVSLRADFPEAALVASVVTIDEKPLTYVEALNMDAEEFAPLMSELSPMLKRIKFGSVL